MSYLGAKFPVSHSSHHVERRRISAKSLLLLWLTLAICISTFLFRKRLE